MATVGDIVVKMRADMSDVAPQMAGVAKAVTDFGAQAAAAGNAITPLGDQIAALEAQGMSLGEALAATGATLDDLVPTVAGIEDAAGGAADALGGVAGGASDAGDAAEESTGIFTRFWESLSSTGEAAAEAESSSNELLKTLLGFAGIALTLEGLKGAVEECFGAFALEERATEALAALTGSTKGAESSIEQLKVQAVKLALPIDELIRADQRMTAFGFDTAKIPAILEATANASRATGISFEQASSSISRIALSGMVSARYLMTLGLSTDALGKAMGVASDQVTKAFKALDASSRLDVLATAMAKYRGLAEVTASDLTGSWQNMKTEAEFAFEEIGKQLAPLAHAFMDWAKEIIPEVKGIVGGIIEFGREMMNLPKVVTVALGAIAVAWAANPMVAAAIGLFQLALAMEGAKEAEAGAAAQTKQYNDSMASTYVVLKRQFTDYPEFTKRLQSYRDELDQGVKSELQYNQAIAALSSEFGKLHPVKLPDSAGTAKPKPVPYDQQKIEIDADAAHQKSLLEQTRTAYEADAKARGLSEQQMLEQLMEFNAEELLITETAIKRKLDLQKGAKEEEKDLTLNAQLQAARDKDASDDIKLQAKVTGETERQFDERVKAHVQALNADLKFQEEVTEHVRKLNEELAADRIKTDEEAARGDMAHQMAKLESQRAVAMLMLNEHRITQQEKLAIDRSIDDQEDALEKKTIHNEIAMLDLRSKAEADYGSKRQALLNQLQAMEDKTGGKAALREIEDQTAAYKTLGIVSTEALTNQVLDAEMAVEQLRAMNAPQAEILQGLQKRLEAELALAAAQSRDASAQIIALTNVQLRQKALADSTNTLGNLYKGLMEDINGAFDKLGQGLVKGIMDIHNFGKAMKDALKSIAEMILTTVIGALMKWIAAQVMLAVLGKAAQNKANQAAIEGSAGRAGAAQVADVMEAVPYPANLWMAPLMAAAAYAEAMGFGAAGKAAKGGIWPEDSVGFFQAEEMTLPADLSRGVRDLIRQGGAIAGNTTNAPMFANCTFTGVTQQLVEDVFSRGTRQLRLSGVRV